MEITTLRGFSNSFLPEIEMVDKQLRLEKPSESVQFIEGSELERTWKSARRLRLKQQEDRIYNEFVKENDVLKTVCTEDPYQFLDQLPEECLKDLMDVELKKMRTEAVLDSKEQKRGAGDTPQQDNQQTVTFSEGEQEDLFRIFDEDRDDNDELSGIEEDQGNESLESPLCTVREHPTTDDTASQSARQHQLTASKSSENMANVIESSIYCAKVKDLRNKIIETLGGIRETIEGVNVACLEQQTLRKMLRRAAEFASRFQRIHLYQIQRQISDINRQNQVSLPFAQHTQFQAQMVRIQALHHYLLHALNVYHKSVVSTACLNESGVALISLCVCVCDALAACRACSPPHHFTAALDLYNDDMESMCDKLETTMKEYTERVTDIINAVEQNGGSTRSKKANKGQEKMKKMGSLSKTSTTKHNPKNGAEVTARLSMYSFETLRREQARGHDGKERKNIATRKKTETPKTGDSPKTKKTPRSRKPWMRAPHGGQAPRRAALQPDTDIHTMVEAVEPPSSHISREQSPRGGRGAARLHHPPAPPSPPPSPSPTPPPPPPARADPTPSPSQHPRNAGQHTPRSLLKRKPTAQTLRNQTETAIEPAHHTSKIQYAKKDAKATTNTEENILSKDHRNDMLSGRTNDGRSGCNSAKSGCDSARSGCELTKSGYDTPRSFTSTLAKGSAHMMNSSRKEKDSNKANPDAESNEVTRLLKQLCGGDDIGYESERRTGAKNAQLVCVNSSSPRLSAPTTPQLLRILEETIQKKAPKHVYHKPKPKDAERLRLAFNIPPPTADKLLQYRTKFVQHMLASSLYANSAVGKPWEMIGCVAERIIDEILLRCAKEMEIPAALIDLYKSETK